MDILFTKSITCDQLVKEVYLIIEEKLDDSSFSVEQLAESVSMSRANLHRKLKTLTNFSPGYLIQKHRLEKAVQYLQQGYNSSQTAYKTGFESPAYFTKCFREHFGITPIQIHQRKKAVL